MEKEYQKFNIEHELVNPTTSGSVVPVRSSCADIVFTNYHPTITAYINGTPLAPASPSAPLGSPGASISYGSNQGEYNEANYQVTAPLPDNDSNGNATLGVWVIRKHYTTVGKIQI